MEIKETTILEKMLMFLMCTVVGAFTIIAFLIPVLVIYRLVYGF